MRNFENWIDAYIEYTQYSEAPTRFHVWTAVSCIAGALRRCAWIEMGYFQWVPNFYIVFVAPPGIVSKSITAGIGMNLLRRVPEIKFGPDVVTWQALAQSLAASNEGVKMEDGTYHDMAAITIASSEFGTFLNPHDREMVDVLVSLWDGQQGAWTKATKTMGNDVIKNPWVNIIAATTPAWIAGNFPEYLIGGGFTSRTIFVYADRKRHLAAYPGDLLPDNHTELGDKLVQDLERISCIRGEYKLSSEARAWGELWYAEHYNNVTKSDKQDERFAGYQARKQTHLHKLAMIIAAAQRDERIILPEDLKTANDMLNQIEADMGKVFERIGQTNTTAAMLKIIELVQRHKKIENSELYRHFSGLEPVEYSEAIRGAIEKGYIGLHSDGTRKYLVSKSDEPAPTISS